MPPQPSLRVLIIEDEDADTQKAIAIFHKLGLEIQSRITVWAARNLLEEIAEGERPAPHLMVLDLGFPNESGFEILRYWKSTPELANIPIIVWTQMGERDRDIAGLFHVSAVVEKSHGLEELEKELKRVTTGLSPG
ncbi:MAG: response regulator with CheY-like receiver domain and winged-helix DNA-binding domain protein [Candidatus Angelobacter sp.]|nr:response regulator with CheY-like receiver domain and winged-helix DNA-binding domain protein [Candidatus Angelobacter sp.]